MSISKIEFRDGVPERLQKYLRYLLLCSGLSEEELSKRSYVSRSYISMIVNGRKGATEDICRAIIASLRDIVRSDPKGYKLLDWILENIVVRGNRNYSEKTIDKVLSMFALSWMRNRDQRIESWDIFIKLYEHYMDTIE